MNESQPELPRKPVFRLGRVLLAVVPLAVVACAGLLAWGYLDLGNRIHRAMLPPLVQVTGQVFLDAKPLKGAQVFTQPVGVRCNGAIAVADDEGRFALRTDVDGDFLDGAYAGEHRVIVLGLDPDAPSGPFKPPLVTPPECSEFDTTPLRIHVDRDPTRNHVEFRLDRPPPPKDAKAKKAFPPKGAKGKGPPGAKGKGPSGPKDAEGKQPPAPKEDASKSEKP
ncbi:MAG: hypothetical protein NUV77_19980 [Thermoguttaceae bacterium]|jgi:hypothetical protein|nr:hypothetical protein [Thermoguttaceae bacterium]